MIAVMQPKGEIPVKPFEVSHTQKELEELAFFIKSLDGETRVIMEHTGKYYEPIANKLHEMGIYVCVVNPILINNYGNNSVRKVKTDKKDALKIAKYGLSNWSELRQYSKTDEIRNNIKLISRQLNLYNKTKVSLKNNLIALLDQAFPNANKLFKSPPRKDGSEKWVDFVLRFWHSECVCGISEKAFIAAYQKWCKKNGYHFKESKAKEIYYDTSSVFPTLTKSKSTKTLITSAAKALISVSKLIEETRTELVRLSKLLPECGIISEIYGCGDTLGAQLAAEIGDVRRFQRKQSLVAFAGVDAPPFQSGKYESKNNKISKRGSPALRKVLFQIMLTYLRTKPADEPVYQFLDKKRSEGKPYYVYMVAAQNKFLRIYYAKVKQYLNEVENLKLLP